MKRYTVLCHEVHMDHGEMDVKGAPEMVEFMKNHPNAKIHTYYGMNSFHGTPTYKIGHLHVELEEAE